MPLSRDEEMAGHSQCQMPETRESRYATREDFLKIFDEDLNGLYQLSLLLTGDHHMAEACFVAGLDDCAKENRVFREWARAWAKRVVVKSAIREVSPRVSRPNALPIACSHHQPLSSAARHFDVKAVLGLADFERFVFVLSVLERYREHDSALLLGCADSLVREARTQALEQLASFGSLYSKQYDGYLRRGQAQALKARKETTHEGTCCECTRWRVRF